MPLPPLHQGGARCPRAPGAPARPRGVRFRPIVIVARGGPQFFLYGKGEASAKTKINRMRSGKPNDEQ
eukprot:11181606-Lingulodinium_polyedra.AAC.1